MLKAERLLVDRQRAFQERLGLVAALVAIEQGEVVERRAELGIIRAELTFGHGGGKENMKVWTPAQDDEAEQLMQRALAIYQKAHGPDHSSIGKALNALAALYTAQGRYSEVVSGH